MRTRAVAILVSIVGELSVVAQNVDVTIHDDSQLRPGASRAETRDWIKSQVIQSAVNAAIQQALNPSAPQYSQQQLQVIKICAVQSQIMDELVREYPALAPERDALYIQYNKELAQNPPSDSNGLSPQQVMLLANLAIRASIYQHLLPKHPELKTRADSLYVQYDQEVVAAMTKASGGN